MNDSVVTEEEIRQTLLENLSEGTTSKRELMRSVIPTRAESESTGSIMYLLSGSPPRGYAIYTPELCRLNFYTPGGERIRYIDDVVGIVAVTDVLRSVVSVLQDRGSVSVEELRECVDETATVCGGVDDVEFSQVDVFNSVLDALTDRGMIVVADSGEGDRVVRLVV